MKKELSMILWSLLTAMPMVRADQPPSERAFREPVRFYKQVNFSMGSGYSGHAPKAMAALGKMFGITGVASSATGAATTSTVTLPAYTLIKNGKSLRVRVYGKTAANGNTKVVNFKFGSTTVALLNAAANNKDFFADIEIYRTGKNAQQINVGGYANNALLNGLSTTSAQDETAGIDVTLELPASTGAADVVLQGFSVSGES